MDNTLQNMTTQMLKEILDNSLADFYHLDGYYVNEKIFFDTNTSEYHHTEFTAYKKLEDGNVKTWKADPYQVIDKLLHMDGVFDELGNRGGEVE